MSVCASVRLSVCPFDRLSVCPSVCPSGWTLRVGLCSDTLRPLWVHCDTALSPKFSTHRAVSFGATDSLLRTNTAWLTSPSCPSTVTTFQSFLGRCSLHYCNPALWSLLGAKSWLAAYWGHHTSLVRRCSPFRRPHRACSSRVQVSQPLDVAGHHLDAALVPARVHAAGRGAWLLPYHAQANDGSPALRITLVNETE